MNRILAALFALALACVPASAATLLPQGKSTFIDGNGKPLAGGTVAFYLPNTTTTKQTWQDAAQSVLNTNPVRLDSAGRATIYGSGAYRQIVKDAAGNLVWDQITADTSSSQIAWGGTSTGTANAQLVAATNFTSTNGQIVGFIAGFTNTGQLTVSANGSGPIPVLVDGQSGQSNLVGQEIQAGAAVLLIYDAGRGAFHLVGASAGAPGFGAQQTLTAANVTDLGLVSTHNVLVAGNAAITSFGSSASATAPVYAIRFTGSGTLASGANLTLPGGNIAYQPNDTAIVLFDGGSSWRVLSYTPAAGVLSPAGMIAPFAMNFCPAGWSAADGTTLARATNLFAAIGTTWGPGDGSTTFNKPDLRGYFLRGFDSGAGRDAGRGFASAQGDSVGPHSHTVPISSFQTGSGSQVTPAYVNNPSTQQTTGQTPAGTSETRPINVAVQYCIKL